MSTNSDLASWGESPAAPAEEALAALLDKVLTKIERGKAVRPEGLRGDFPELLEQGRELIPTLSLLYECAASIWEGSRFEPGDDPAGASSAVSPQPDKDEKEMQRTPLEQAAPMPDPFPGEFLIRRLLGEGEFGKVWLADELKLGRQVALKTLKLPAASTLGPHVLAALRKEAQHLAQLDHPNIVRVHAWREAAGEYYLVLQFVAGGSLADKLKAEKVLGWQDAARYVADVGEALAAAHKRGVVHRDVKPDNILWDAARNEAMLTDFGVSARLAEPGTAAGTPIYMAPEAFEGRVSPALDVYSLAATLYRLATGKFPFATASTTSLASQKLQGLPNPDPSFKAVPEPLERVIRAGLAGKPEDRPNMADFAATLRGALNQLLADALATPTIEAERNAAVNLRLVVSRLVQGGAYDLVAKTKPASSGLSRDMKKVPPPPEQVSLRTGERVRIEVVADKTGYVTVFNIGPTGNLNLLYPEETAASQPPRLEANQPLQVIDVEMSPPAGRERVVVVWSKQPLPLRLDQLLGIVDSDGGTSSRPYQSTRDMKRVQHSVAALPSAERQVATLEIDQSPR